MGKNFSVTIEKNGPGIYEVVATDWTGNVKILTRRNGVTSLSAARRKAAYLRAKLSSGNPL